MRSPHLPFGVGDFFVEGFLGVSNPHHGGLELAGHLQGETVGCKCISLWGAHLTPGNSRTRRPAVLARGRLAWGAGLAELHCAYGL